MSFDFNRIITHASYLDKKTAPNTDNMGKLFVTFFAFAPATKTG